MKAIVTFTETRSKRSLIYTPEIEFKSIRGMKVSLKNCISRNMHNLQMYFGYCCDYVVTVNMNGKEIAKTTLSC